MVTFADLEEFVRLIGPVARAPYQAGRLMPHGYRLEVACPCGVVFERWVRPQDAGEDLLTEAFRAMEDSP